MTRNQRAALWIAAIVGVGALSAWLFQRPIGMWLFDRAVERGVARDPLAALPDGLHVGLCGTGSPLPARERSEEHTSELQSLMRISYAVFCLKKKKTVT